MAILKWRRAALGAALALGVGGTGIGAFLLTSERASDAVVEGGGIRLATTRQTMEAGAWLSDRGLLRGVRFSRGHGVTGFEIDLIPAPGVVLPTGRVESGGVRFNEDGEVVEILPLAADNPCVTLLVQDTENPRRWIISCLGVCPSDGSPCIPMIDLTTLQIVCDCFA